MDATLFAHIPALNPEIKAPRIEYAYQELGLECEEYFGKNHLIWIQFSRKGATEHIIRYALKECKTKNKPFVGYFIKIISNKIKK